MTDQEILDVLNSEEIEFSCYKQHFNEKSIKKHILFMAHGNFEKIYINGVSSGSINVGSEGAECCEAAICVGFGCDIEA